VSAWIYTMKRVWVFISLVTSSSLTLGAHCTESKIVISIRFESIFPSLRGELCVCAGGRRDGSGAVCGLWIVDCAMS